MRQDMAVDQIYNGNSFRIMVNRMKIYQVLTDINEQEALKDSDYNCFFKSHINESGCNKRNLYKHDITDIKIIKLKE